MKKWYKESYFNRKNWILENFNKLNLNSDETLFILFVELCKESKRNITYELLCDNFKTDVKHIDKIIASLVNKGYLSLSTNSRGLVLDIDAIFEFDPNTFEISENKDLYDTLNDVFGKPLTQLELEKVNDLVNEYGQAKLLQATRIADANRKLKLSYIEGILRNEKKL